MRDDHTFAVCAHNESPYLTECIDSLVNQEAHSNIIICTSTPNNYIKKITSEYKLELKINPNQDGIAADWNFALRQVNTDYVTLAHQDDIYLPRYSQKIQEALNNHPDSLIAHTNYQDIVHSHNRIYTRTVSLNFVIKRLLNMLNFLGFGSPIGCPTVTYNLKNLNNFSFSNSFSINMDWYAWYQISKMRGSIIWINKTLMSHRIHSDSETSRGLAKNLRQKEDLMMFRKFWPNTIATILSQLYTLSYKNNL